MSLHLHTYRCICGLTCTCACVCGGPALTLELFLNLSPLYLLRQDLFLVQLAHCSRISSTVLGLQVATMSVMLYTCYEDLNSGSHTYISSFLPS